VPVSCAVGFTTSNSSHPNTCVEVCGDGIRTGAEVCDDMNVLGGDGCSADCRAIQQGFACDWDKDTDRDICTRCPLNFAVSQDQRACVPGPINGLVYVAGYSFVALLAVDVLFSLAMSAFYGKSLTHALWTVQLLQMLMLLRVVDVEMGDLLTDFYRILSGAWLTFDFIPDSWVFFGNGGMFEWLDHRQNVPYLKLFGFRSGSALFNMKYILFVVLLIAIPAIVCITLSLIIRKCLKESKIRTILNKVANVMVFRVGIRLFFVSFLFLVVNSLNEMMNTYLEHREAASYTFGCITFTLLCFVTFLIYTRWVFSTHSDSKSQFIYTSELINMTRETRLAHSYSFVWPLRRLLVAIFVMTLRSTPYYYSVGFILLVQITYIAYLSAVRPLTSIRAMIFEIGGEVIFIVTIIFMFLLNDRDNWTTERNWIYISAIWLVGAIHFVVTMCKFKYIL